MAPIVPPFTAETAQQKVKVAQDLWNTRQPDKVCLAYTVCTCIPIIFCDFITHHVSATARHHLAEPRLIHEGPRGSHRVPAEEMGEGKWVQAP